MTTSTFREQAEKRIAELEARDRQVQAEARAAEQRASQQELRERRERAQRDAAERAATDARARLTRRFGLAATKVSLRGEYWAFSCPSRDVLIAISRPPGSTSRDNWRHHQRLQAALGVGLDPPAIVVGAQLGEADEAVDRLLIDPDSAALAALNPTSQGAA